MQRSLSVVQARDNGGLQGRRRSPSKLTIYDPRNLMPFCGLSGLIRNLIIPLYNTRSTGAPAAEIIYIFADVATRIFFSSASASAVTAMPAL